MHDVLWQIAPLLAPRPGRFEFAVRLALICALTILVTEIYQTPDAALTAYVAFFLHREDRAMSLILDVVMVVLVTLIIGFVLLVAMVVADDPMWRVVSMAAISFSLLFLTSASKLRPIGSTIALIVGYGLDQLGAIHLGELATRGYLYAWLFVGIPAGVSITVNLLIAPPPRRLAQRAIARRLDLAAAMLQAPDDRIRRQFREILSEGVVEIRQMLHLADRERTCAPRDLAALQHAADSTVGLLSAIDVIDRNPDAWLTVSLREFLSRTLREMSAILKSGGYPVRIGWQAPPPERPLTPLEADVLAEIEDAIVGFAEVSDLSAPKASESKDGDGFFVADAFANPDHVHYALKTTAAAMFCYILYSLLDWPGIHTCFITCYIVSLGTTAETVEKLTLRILGCLAGAAAGYCAIILLLPHLTSIVALMIVVFIGILPAAYVAAGGPRISYAGFQIAFAFLLCVVQGSAPAFDLTIARDRVIGILLGNVVVFLLFTHLWPISVGKRIDPAIAALLRRLGKMMTESNRQTRRALASENQAALAAIKTDLDLAGYEPGALRPNEEWLVERCETVHEIATLEAPLLLSANQNPTTSAQIRDRLEHLARRFVGGGEQTSHDDIQLQSQWMAAPLFRIIDRGLRRLEEASV